MSWFKKAQIVPEQTPVSGNPLDGMIPAQAKKVVNNKIIPHDRIKGFFSDENWAGIQQIWDAFNNAGLNWSITNSEYTNDGGVPTGKTWNIQIDFTNKRGQPMSIFGVVRAAGAGTVEEPLDRYDIVAYFA